MVGRLDSISHTQQQQQQQQRQQQTKNSREKERSRGRDNDVYTSRDLSIVTKNVKNFISNETFCSMHLNVPILEP
jgi:hypothetical protein